MSDETPSGSSSKSWIAVVGEIAEGGLLRVATSKAVEKAIGRFLFGLGDVPDALFDRWSQSIRSETAAKKQITAAIATAISENIAEKHPKIVDAAAHRWTRHLIAKQEIRNKIAAATINLLAEEDLTSTAGSPTEDFMCFFENIAEKASSEQLTDLMARILAGEIRKPGSITRKTLQVVSVIDADIIKCLVEAKSHILKGDWIHVSPSRENDWRKIFATLNSVSISSEVSPRTLVHDENHMCNVLFYDYFITMRLKPGLVGWMCGGAHLNPIGRELAAVLPPTTRVDPKTVALEFKEYDFVQQIWVGEYGAEQQADLSKLCLTEVQ